MVVEPRLARAQAVALLAVAGQGRDANTLPPLSLPPPGGEFVAVQANVAGS